MTDSLPQTPAWRWPRIQRRPALAMLGLMTAIGLWLGCTAWLSIQASGDTIPWSRPLLWELTGALAVYPLIPILLTAALNAPHPRIGWARFLGIHAAAFALYTGLHVLLMASSRNVLYPLLGWGQYDYGDLTYRVPMEAQKDIIVYTVSISILVLIQAWRDRQARALREARLETELRQARLQALVGQLDPHFLFNALNTVSALVYEDPARTDKLVSALALLLRASLESGARPTWPLRDERAHTERFLALMQARFGARLTVRWEQAPDLDATEVPRFALQVLAENALKHNRDRAEPLELRLRAQRDGAQLVLEVEDTGRGFGGDSPARGSGLGLANLAQALALLHGDGGRLERGAGPEGGARVTLRMPLGAGGARP